MAFCDANPRRCEIWTQEPQATEGGAAPTHSCYKKLGVQTTVTTTAAATTTTAQDHSDLSVVIGKAIGHRVSNGKANGDMAPAMNGEVTGVSYKSLGLPAEVECACLSGTSCKGVSGWHATISLTAASKMCLEGCKHFRNNT